MHLLSIYGFPNAYQLLYDLLKERTVLVNISHKVMPSWPDHMKFVESRPYKAWYFICDPLVVGACYLSKLNEIGVFIFKECQYKGYGTAAVTKLMDLHGPGRYLANINGRNEPSKRMFARLGFIPIQETFALIR